MMKRPAQSEAPLNLHRELNYVPYRQKDKFLSPQMSIVSRRTSLSFKSPQNLNRCKLSLKQRELFQQKALFQDHISQKSSTIPQFLIQQKEENQKSPQVGQKVVEQEIQQPSKMEESMSLTTEQFEDHKAVEVFNEVEHKNQNQNEFLQPESQIQSSFNQPIEESPEKNEDEPLAFPKKLKTEKKVGILKNPSSPSSAFKKSVKFITPNPQKKPSPKQTSNLKRNKSDQNFANVLRNLKMKNRPPFENKIKKQAKKQQGNSRLLMRFKKKAEPSHQ